MNLTDLQKEIEKSHPRVKIKKLESGLPVKKNAKPRQLGGCAGLYEILLGKRVHAKDV